MFVYTFNRLKRQEKKTMDAPGRDDGGVVDVEDHFLGHEEGGHGEALVLKLGGIVLLVSWMWLCVLGGGGGLYCGMVGWVGERQRDPPKKKTIQGKEGRHFPPDQPVHALNIPKPQHTHPRLQKPTCLENHHHVAVDKIAHRPGPEARVRPHHLHADGAGHRGGQAQRLLFVVWRRVRVEID